MNLIFPRLHFDQIIEFQVFYRTVAFKSMNEFILIVSQHKFWWNAKSLFAKIFFDNVKSDTNSIINILNRWLDNFVVAIFKFPYLCDEWAE